MMVELQKRCFFLEPLCHNSEHCQYKEWIEEYGAWYCGCASHSSAKSDAVLDELESFFQHYERNHIKRLWTTTIILDKIKELRSQQKER